jgi:hypothetical protein
MTNSREPNLLNVYTDECSLPLSTAPPDSAQVPFNPVIDNGMKDYEDDLLSRSLRKFSCELNYEIQREI